MKRSAAAIPAVAGRSRSIYTATVDRYTKKFGKNSGVIITPSYLRLESAALGTQGSINFAVLKNELANGQSTMSATEKRLAPSDNFLATEIGIFIMKVASGSTTSKNPLDTFPNSLVYTGTGEANNLRNIYAGNLGIKINSTQILESWDVLRHLRVGNAQKAVLTAASGTGNAWDQSTWDSASFGFYPLTPQIELKGQSKNDINISLPTSIDLAGTSSSNYAVIIFRGLLIQNGSVTVQS